MKAMHQPTDMIAVVTDAELALDDLGDARRGPQLRPVAVRRRSLQQQPQQATPLAHAQLERTPGRETNSQGVGASAAARPQPAHHGTRRAADATPDFVQRQAGVPQRQRAPATVFEQIGTALPSGHNRSLPKGIVLHYLCRHQ
ncbi:MAG: hypothetical protein M1335_07950 [Chloroflexi bacterium]|nr:hypothetical protein [Chloroflexota bacterium]